MCNIYLSADSLTHSFQRTQNDAETRPLPAMGHTVSWNVLPTETHSQSKCRTVEPGPNIFKCVKECLGSLMQKAGSLELSITKGTGTVMHREHTPLLPSVVDYKYKSIHVLPRSMAKRLKP